MSKLKFKKGDRVMVVPPKGKTFEVGVRGFNSGVTKSMVDIVKKKNLFTVERMFWDGSVHFKECGYTWDSRWLEYVPTENNNKKKVITIDFILSNKETKAVSLNKVGVTNRDPRDEYNETTAMIVSLARMLGLSEDKVSQIIDVLYDDIPKGLEDSSIKDLIQELQKRI